MVGILLATTLTNSKVFSMAIDNGKGGIKGKNIVGGIAGVCL
jgi:hypothetical protein